jgi:predicted nucleic acid-binding protein
MSNKPKLIYWDSCVFISAIQRTKDRFDILNNILDDAKADKIKIVSSTLAIAEIVKLEQGLDSSKLTEDASRIKDFLENKYFHIRNVDRAIAEEAASIAREFKIKPQDAIHVATALRYQCSCLQTYDGGLLGLDSKIGRPPLRIELPHCLSGDNVQKEMF